jgi:hypothetical protein
LLFDEGKVIGKERYCWFAAIVSELLDDCRANRSTAGRHDLALGHIKLCDGHPTSSRLISSKSRTATAGTKEKPAAMEAANR